ncbi:MAG: hypothetical protein ABS76_05920 [Pelagibacterium sp. SCN 64-44]|nr:MAG: hypothetical protein ABS76_05920 [Pelagibacterium sp. SCN 64-44]
MGKHVFCTDLCHQRGEPLAGTGDAPQRALLLAWSRSKWRTPRWESSDMSPELRAVIYDAAMAGLYVGLIDKVETDVPLPTLHAQPENVYATFEHEPDLIAAIRDYVEGRMFEGIQDTRSTIICCTDSRRDACCARYGFSTYKALVAAADPARFNIVQCTHIGGCRFAASLVVMPARQRYGRMTAAHAPAFLGALDRGEIYLPTYKGRSDHPEPAQVAELAALNWAAEHGQRLDAVPLHGAIPEHADEGAELTLEADLPGTHLAIRLQARNFLVQGNCDTVAEGGGQTMLRWCLDTITAEPIRT